MYDIGDLEPSDIIGLFNDKIQELRRINNNQNYNNNNNSLPKNKPPPIPFQQFNNPLPNYNPPPIPFQQFNNELPKNKPPLTPVQKKEILSKIANMKQKSMNKRKKSAISPKVNTNI